MTFLVILAFIDILLMLVVNPFNVVTWIALFTTASFMLRPLGINVKVSRIIPVEVLIAFLAINGSMIMKTFSLKTYIMMLLLRLVFYAIVYYDDTQFVYIQEKEEREL